MNFCFIHFAFSHGCQFYAYVHAQCVENGGDERGKHTIHTRNFFFIINIKLN